jgi:hypothetical protein
MIVDDYPERTNSFLLLHPDGLPTKIVRRKEFAVPYRPG